MKEKKEQQKRGPRSLKISLDGFASAASIKAASERTGGMVKQQDIRAAILEEAGGLLNAGAAELDPDRIARQIIQAQLDQLNGSSAAPLTGPDAEIS